VITREKQVLADGVVILLLFFLFSFKLLYYLHFVFQCTVYEDKNVILKNNIELFLGIFLKGLYFKGSLFKVC